MPRRAEADTSMFQRFGAASRSRPPDAVIRQSEFQTALRSKFQCRRPDVGCLSVLKGGIASLKPPLTSTRARTGELPCNLAMPWRGASVAQRPPGRAAVDHTDV